MMMSLSSHLLLVRVPIPAALSLYMCVCVYPGCWSDVRADIEVRPGPPDAMAMELTCHYLAIVSIVLGLSYYVLYIPLSLPLSFPITKALSLRILLLLFSFFFSFTHFIGLLLTLFLFRYEPIIDRYNRLLSRIPCSYQLHDLVFSCVKLTRGQIGGFVRI